MLKASVLLDQSRKDWRGMNCLWSRSGKRCEYPELVDVEDQAECYLVIAAADLAALAGLARVQDRVSFDPTRPVIWIDYEHQEVDVFGCTAQLIAEIRKKMRDTESNIRRLVARLLVS
jgi:hypothetical protein